MYRLPKSPAALAPWQVRTQVSLLVPSSVVMSRTSMYFHSLFEFWYFWMWHCEEAPATHSTIEWILPQQQDLASNQIQSLSNFAQILGQHHAKSINCPSKIQSIHIVNHIIRIHLLITAPYCTYAQFSPIFKHQPPTKILQNLRFLDQVLSLQGWEPVSSIGMLSNSIWDFCDLIFCNLKAINAASEDITDGFWP